MSALFFAAQLFFAGGLFFAQAPSGRELSDALSSRLKRAGFAGQQKPLSSAWFAEFPYNIELDFPSSEESEWTFILAVSQEDAFREEEFMGGLLSHFKSAYLPCNLKIVFTAGDEARISGNEKMAGSEIFCKSVEGAQNMAALVLDIGEGKRNFITPGSDGELSPYYLTRLLCEVLDNNFCSYQLSGGPFLALYRLMALKKSERLSSFLTIGIPAVELTLSSKSKSRSLESSAIKDFVSMLDTEKCGEWSRHYISLRIFSKRRWLSERSMLLNIFFLTSLALFALADFAFLFRKRSRRLLVLKMTAIFSNYLIFVTAAVLTLSFGLGQYLAKAIENLGVRNLMALFVIKLTPAFLLVSMVYPLELLRHKKISTYLYEYILLVSALLNIFIFTFIDISFFYLFGLQYIILAFSRLFKRSGSLFIFLTLFVIPFLPLLYSILIFSNGQKVYNLVFCGVKENILLAFVLTPFNLLWLRILARMNLKSASARALFVRYGVAGISAVVFFAAFSALTIYVMGRLFFNAVEPEPRRPQITDANANLFSAVSVYDSDYYGGKIRRIEISCQKKPERTSVCVNGSGSNPVYFSIYETETHGRITQFLLPENPPQKFTVQYTPDPASDSEILVMNYFIQEEEDEAGQKRELCLRESFSFEAAGGSIKERQAQK